MPESNCLARTMSLFARWGYMRYARRDVKRILCARRIPSTLVVPVACPLGVKRTDMTTGGRSADRASAL